MASDRKKGVPIYHVDAFTDEPFRGNPAAVCLLKREYGDQILQSIAVEMNLSETAFLYCPRQESFRDSESFSLRWFTPKTEVPLCGHATLATAAVLFFDIEVLTAEIGFETKSGRLTAKREGNQILLDFPGHETVHADPPMDLLKAMGITRFKDVRFSQKMKSFLIHLPNEEILANLEPDFERMKSAIAEEDIIGVIVTSKGHSPYDFVSRFFAPWVGINEDPVTGAAHTVLGPFWSRILGKNEMLAYQASSRGGTLIARLSANNRVNLMEMQSLYQKESCTCNICPRTQGE